MKTMEKVTKRDNFNAIIKLATEANRPDLVDFAKHEIELLEKKASAPRKESEAHVASEKLAQTVLDLMEVDKLYRVADLIKLVGDPDISTSKMSTAIRLFLLGSSVERVEEKRVAYFKRIA